MVLYPLLIVDIGYMSSYIALSHTHALVWTEQGHLLTLEEAKRGIHQVCVVQKQLILDLFSPSAK